MKLQLYYKDANGIYLGCNRAYEEFCGLDGAQITGKTSHDINTFELAGKCSKADAELIESAGKLSEETFMRLPDGTVRAAILNRATFLNADGKVGGLVGVILDIEERKRAEDDLRRSKEYIEKIVGSVNEGLCVFDTEGKHVMVNSALCAITGYESDELIGVGPPYPYWPSEEQEPIEDAYRKTVNGELQDFRLVLKRKNGQCFPVLASPGVIRDENGEILNYIVTVKDLTEFTLLRITVEPSAKDGSRRSVDRRYRS